MICLRNAHGIHLPCDCAWHGEFYLKPAETNCIRKRNLKFQRTRLTVNRLSLFIRVIHLRISVDIF